MYEPIVHEVTGVMAFAEDGNMAVALGPDPVAALVDACRVFQIARNATRVEDIRIEAKRRETKGAPPR